MFRVICRHDVVLSRGVALPSTPAAQIPGLWVSIGLLLLPKTFHLTWLL